MKRPTPQTQEAKILRLAGKRGLLRARDTHNLGIPTTVLTRLVRNGKLERVSRGIYTLPGAQMSAQRSLAEVSLRTPRGVICLLSALRLHDIGTQAPFEVWLALPPGVTARQMDGPSIRIIRMSGQSLTKGVEKMSIDGVAVPVFCAAKTVADCFKFRNKIGLDVALEALRETHRARKASIDEIWRYAVINRVGNVMRPYMEALTA